MKKKVLPISYPPITSYTEVANVMSILWFNKEKVLPWLGDHYMQLFMLYDNNQKSIFGNFYDSFGINKVYTPKHSPFCDLTFFDRVTLNRSLEKFTDFIEWQIDNGYYIHIPLNQRYLNCSDNFQKNDFIHPTFVFGYDSFDNSIKVGDFYSGGKYSYESVSYDEINDSYSKSIFSNNDPKWFQQILLMKWSEGIYSTQIELLKKYSYDYIAGKDSFSKFEYESSLHHCKLCYGIKFYDMLSEHFKENSWKTADIRAFHVLADHKALMKIRLDYLHQEKFIQSDCYLNLSKKCEELIKMCIILRNIVLKYRINGNEVMRDKIIQQIGSIKEYDLIFMEAFVKSIEDVVK